MFLDDGDVQIDNNASERAIRGFCIGKKNWEMIDTINGATSSAIIYSIAETAKANDLKPFAYFEYLLTEIPKHAEDKSTDFLTCLLYTSGKEVSQGGSFCPFCGNIINENVKSESRESAIYLSLIHICGLYLSFLDYGK